MTALATEATTLFQAWKHMRIGPHDQAIERGDIIDLNDPGWGLPVGRGKQLVDNRYGSLVTGGTITVRPGPVAPSPAVTTLPEVPQLPELS